MEQYIIDIVLAAIFLGFTIFYAVQGFAKKVLNFAAFLVSIVASKIASGYVTDWVFSNTRLFTGLEKYLAKLIIVVLCFVIIYFVLSKIAAIIDKLFKIPVLKQAKKLFGGLLGALSGLIVVIVLSFVLQISSNVVYNSKYVSMVESSRIVQTVLSHEKVLSNIDALR